MGAAKKSSLSFNERLTALYYRNPLYRVTLVSEKPAVLRLPPQDMLPAHGVIGGQVARGEFALEGQTFFLTYPDWSPPGSSRLWQASLHSFDWLRHLKAFGGDSARRIARTFTSQWLDDFDQWHAVAWRPDVMGTRLATWLTLHDFFLSSAEDSFRLSIYDSIAQQSSHLSRVLTSKAEGIALLKGLRGFLLASLALDRPHHVNDALDLYQSTLSDQLLSDGGHVSRSPYRMAALLRQMIEARNALRAARHPVPDNWQAIIDRLAGFVKFFRHGDGTLALFHGTTEHDPVYLDTLLNLADAKARAFKSCDATAYERLQAGRTVVLTDTGGIPPAPFDVGAHAGCLSFEMSAGRERLIVNCGTEPGSGPWHNALRATAAHSALSVKDTNCAEIIDDRGIGKRRPERVPVERIEDDQGIGLTAAHDGYLFNFGIVQQRKLHLSHAGDELTGEDILKRLAAEKDGAETDDYEFVIRFHLAPHAQITLSQDQHSALIRLPSGAGWRLRCGDAKLGLDASIYCGKFRDTQRSQQIIIQHILIGQDVTVNWSLKREKK